MTHWLGMFERTSSTSQLAWDGEDGSQFALGHSTQQQGCAQHAFKPAAFQSSPPYSYATATQLFAPGLLPGDPSITSQAGARALSTPTDQLHSVLNVLTQWKWEPRVLWAAWPYKHCPAHTNLTPLRSRGLNLSKCLPFPSFKAHNF